jgi:hypothetical protein
LIAQIIADHSHIVSHKLILLIHDIIPLIVIDAFFEKDEKGGIEA